MQQQVNLFQAQFRPQKNPYSAASMAMVLGFFLLALGGLFAYSQYQLLSLETGLARLDSNIENRHAQLASLVSQLPTAAKSKLLESEIARLKKELETRREIRNALASHSLENKRLFSALLESLARKHVQGTWLTRVSISEGGEALAFEGKTFASELVPLYIQSLSSEKSFAGLSFNVLQLQRSETDPANLDFQVGTRPGPM